MVTQRAKQGGAIFADGGSVTISNSSFTQNNASYEGGAILAKVPLTITGTGFYGNYVDSILAEGGAIHQAFSHLTINNSSFGGNRALDGSGGAIQMDYAKGDSTISDSYFFSNQVYIHFMEILARRRHKHRQRWTIDS